MRIQHLEQSRIVVEVLDLAASNKKKTARILHVDDDRCLLEVSKQILTMENSFDVDNAISVDEAFKKMGEQQYDAIVSDYEMPLKNGLEFLEEIRTQRMDIPFILFTGKGREDVAVKALNLGADSYINKNGSPETVYCELADAINKTVERKKSRKLLAKSEAKYHALVENSLQGISILQVAPLRLVFANGAMGKILDYSSEELMSLSPEGIMGLVHHEDRAFFFRRMENRLRGEPAGATYEFRAVRKDGSIIWLSALANRVEYEGQPAVQGMFLDINESKKTEEILRENEARYRELANSLPDIVFETDLNGQLVFANERATEISGYSQGELEKGLNIMQFLLPEDREKATKTIQRLLSGGNYVPTEYTFLRKNGTTFPALITATPCISKNKVTGLRGLVLDITERKRTEERLEKEQQELNRIIDSSPIIIFYKDNEGKFIRVNEAFAEAQKIPKENFFGKTVFDFYSAEIARGMANDDLAVLKSGCPKLGIIEQYESASGMRWVQTDKVPTFDKNGVSTGLVGFTQDITERKKADLALLESEGRLRTIFEGASDGILVVDPKTKSFVFANPRICEITGYSLKELLKLNVSDIHPEKDLPHATDQFTKQAQGKITLAQDIPILRKDSKVVYCDINSRPAKIGAQEYLVGFFRDVTERRKAKEVLRESEESFRSLIDSMDDLVFVLGLDGIFKNYHQPSHTKELFAAPEEFIGKHFQKVLPQHVAELCQAAIERIEDSGETQEFDYILGMNGEKSWYNARLSPTKDQSGQKTSVTIVVRNISERKKKDLEIKQKNEALVQERDMLESVTAASGAGLVIISKDYHVLWANDFIKRYKGDTIGKLCYATLNSLDSPCQDCGVAKIYAGKTTLDSHEYCSTTVDGNPYWVEIVATPLTDEKGNVTSAVEICVDITERKKNEEKLKESIQRNELVNEKLSVVGSLTRHDVGNKLMVIKSNIYLLKKQIGDNPKLVKYLEDIASAIKSSDALFEFSRFYEKIGVEETSKKYVDRCFNQAAMLLPSLGTIKIVNDCQGLEVMADSLLKQLFYNFLDNSLKHGEKVTQIRLHYTEDDNGLKLFYEDNGVGVSEADKPKLFHEGFSTGKSTGLGLFLIKRIAQVYGWTIIEEGEPGKGAKFTITIPNVNQNGKKNFQIIL